MRSSLHGYNMVPLAYCPQKVNKCLYCLRMWIDSPLWRRAMDMFVITVTCWHLQQLCPSKQEQLLFEQNKQTAGRGQKPWPLCFCTTNLSYNPQLSTTFLGLAWGSSFKTWGHNTCARMNKNLSVFHWISACLTRFVFYIVFL